MRAPFILLALSALNCTAQESVTAYWSGALSPTSIQIRARLSGPTDSVRVLACAPPCTDEVASPYTAAEPSTDLVAELHLQGLLPNTPYTYRFEVNDAPDASGIAAGSFTTPGFGAASFSFVAGSCNGSSSHPVWQAMRDQEPLFFLSTGDLHYRDPNSTEIDPHRAPYREDVLSPSPMKEFLHATPIAYVWDDHDFCGNGSDASFIGKASAARAYREYVPHYPLHHPISVHQSFTIGRVHFILSDLRSTKTDEEMMSGAQLAWLLSEMLYARDNGLVAAWVTSLTWNSVGYPENWACQPTERTALNDVLFALGVKDLFIIAGDAHMLAIDDGANADFSTSQDLRYHYPIFQAAALARWGSYKGGQFNQGGVHPNPSAEHGQFGEIVVDDDGFDLCVTFNGWQTDGQGAGCGLVNSYTFCRTPGQILVGAPQPTNAGLISWYAEDTGLMVQVPERAVDLEVEVRDAIGRLLLHERRAARHGLMSLPMPHLSQGLHTASIRCGDQRSSLRFMAGPLH
ncbi:MAG: alkaline phosphatase D family protein [Flavobacteriales bacterium]|nr:alkaline phosphatase D family protein [Flavobacteriales bacterium]